MGEAGMVDTALVGGGDDTHEAGDDQGLGLCLGVVEKPGGGLGGDFLGVVSLLRVEGGEGVG